MTPQDAAQSVADASRREKNRVAGFSLAAAFLLTGLKLGVGLWTNSLGILSEAAHSGLDLVAAAITFWAIHVSVRPADADHTYGHGKVENLSALAETFLLLVTCVWIFRESGRRLFGGKEVDVLANFWAFGVVAVSIVIDFSRSRALRRVALKYKSQALEADALHFSTDIWSSAVVFLGLGGVWIAGRFNAPWLHKADAAAAFFVAIIVVWVSMRLGKRAVDELVDAAPSRLRDDIRRAARVRGVRDVKQVRVRRSGPDFFADVILTVEGSASFEQAHHVADEAEQAVRGVIPGADVVVHVEPTVRGDIGLPEMVRRIAARRGLDAHSIHVFHHADGIAIELHLEVDRSLCVEEAHKLASGFEDDLRAACPSCVRIVTHIEPAGSADAYRVCDGATRERVENAAGTAALDSGFTARAHDFEIRHADGGLDVSFHVATRPDANIADAHLRVERLETLLRSRMPELRRVSIHLEPENELRVTNDELRIGPPERQ